MSAARANGLVAVLVTDIEGSTRLWERDPEAMRRALSRHDRILTAAITGHGGRVVRERGEGDSFFALFHGPDAAVRAAAVAQCDLHAEPWPLTPIRVRMAIHMGPWDRARRFPVAARCARLRGAAHGGQVLISGAARRALASPLPEGLDVLDLGTHRLKDLTEPERIFQLRVPGLPSKFPPLATIDPRRTALPLQLSSFVGREDQISELRAILRQARLLTLAGPPGVGKTRLGLQLAAEALDDYEGTWFVELAAVMDGEMVGAAVAAVLGIRERPDENFEDLLADALGSGRSLLVLDNCEHLTEAVANLVESLLRACPGLTVLATSQRVLNVAGEHAWRVPALPVDPGIGAGAVQLFLERAAAARAHETLGEDEIGTVAEICRRLDGIPLAIELAAARIRLMSPQEILHGLGDRFALLGAGARTRVPHQRTLAEALSWSYEMLDPDEAALFQRASIFRGTFSFEALKAVAGAEVTDVDGAAARLVDRSLLQVDAAGPRTRYRVLESLRQFAALKLGESDRAKVARSHLDHYMMLAFIASADALGPGRVARLDGLEQEHDNLAEALHWGEAHDLDSALLLAGALAWFWESRGRIIEGRMWLTRLLSAGGGPRPRATALLGVGRLAVRQSLNDEGGRAFREARALCADLEEVRGVARALMGLGAIDLNEGRYDVCWENTHEARDLLRALGDPVAAALAETQMAQVAQITGDSDNAMRLAKGAFEVGEGAGSQTVMAIAGSVLGYSELSSGRLDAAEKWFRGALDLFRGMGELWGINYELEALAAVAAARGQGERALVLFGATRAERERAALPQMSIFWRSEQERWKDLAWSAAAAPAEAFARGLKIGLEDAVELALST